jgi:hypothetical protein
MHSALYDRTRASAARMLAKNVTDDRAAEILAQTAEDYEDIAEDLEIGAVEIRHPDLLPQRRKPSADES